MASSRQVKRRKVEASQVEISTFCHATEDCSRVEESIRTLLPSELQSQSLKIIEDEKEGYYGNPIRILTLKITSKQQVEILLNYLASKMSSTEKSILGATFDLRYDSKTGRFIARFSKQDLYLGSVKVSDVDDVVKVTVYLKNTKKSEDAFEYLKTIGLIY
jgi:RNA binding exosome subunit